MIVLHAIWDHSVTGTLHLWAESSDLSVITARRAKRRTEEERARLHPFVLPPAVLEEVVDDLVGGLFTKGAQAGMLALRLPSVVSGPLPSPELLLDEKRGVSQGAELEWWDVATLQLDASHALDFLLRLPNQSPHGVAFSGSLHFWSEAAKFAFELITRQCFIPSLYEGQRGNTVTCRATWEAVLSPEDLERLRLLAKAMPPICWAFMPPGEKKASLLQDVLLHFINQFIDAFVRESLTSTSFPRGVKGTNRRALPERWLRALASPDPELTVSSAELTDFSVALRTWLDQIRLVPGDSPFRTCFKLDPPAEDQEDAAVWKISFHLQASDDPSLLIPAEQVWQERSSTLTFLKRKFENPQERLLADLGNAARLFPTIEKSLESSHPRSLPLSTEQAYMFLRETAPLLEDSGFGVLVPPWWHKSAARLGAKLQVTPKSTDSSGLLGLSNLVNYSWSIAVGDTTLTPEEFSQLVALKQPLVQVRGQWVELRPDQIEAAIAFFEKKRKKQNMSLGEALRVGMAREQSELGLPVIGMETEGWIKDILDRLYQRVQLTPIEVPATFQGQLRPYQLRGVSWLAFLRQFGFGSCLADDMGLGKTIQLITLLLHERGGGRDVPKQQLNPTLLICPMSIVGNWQREVQRFAPSLSVMIHHGAERLSGPAFIEEARRHDIVITTYSLALRDKGHLAEIEWENVVIDEAQNIKNETAKQTQAIKSLDARHKIALTGTPVENRLSELWSIMEFLNPGYLGSGTDFRKSFALPIERYHDAEQAAVLKQLVQPFVLRRLKTDKEIIQDLPDKLEMKVFCNLTQEQASLYEAVVKEMLEKIEEEAGDMARRGLILSALMRLKQICNHPAQFMSDGSSLQRRSGKLARLEEMLEEVLAEGDKALIFTQFAEMGALLRQYLQEALGVETLFLHGGTPKKQRDILVQRFQEERRGAPLFILSLKAGGVGLNLTAANHVFHFDRWWNPAVENQATDRAFRIGQKKNVQVHKFVCAGTLEERIDQMIEQKKDLAERIVGAGENWLTEMSTDQLKELFALSREAVGE